MFCVLSITVFYQCVVSDLCSVVDSTVPVD